MFKPSLVEEVEEARTAWATCSLVYGYDDDRTIAAARRMYEAEEELRHDQVFYMPEETWTGRFLFAVCVLLGVIILVFVVAAMKM
jgi:hypothetical protein